jgi:hypothetical protein
VIVPPYMVKLPGTCATPAPATCGSLGMGNVVAEAGSQPETPRQALAVATVRLKDVR